MMHQPLASLHPTIKSGVHRNRITPRDINRLVQFTTYTHHQEPALEAADMMDMYDPMSGRYVGDGIINFTEYESFMEAMLVLYGDSSSPPDLDQIFDEYGVEPTYNLTNPDPATRMGTEGVKEKVISIESIPISEYWFKKLFGSGAPYGFEHPLYSWIPDPIESWKMKWTPIELYKYDVLQVTCRPPFSASSGHELGSTLLTAITWMGAESLLTNYMQGSGLLTQSTDPQLTRGERS
jgi:hypothetical protein